MFFYASKQKEYHFCTQCTSISLSKDCWLPESEEKKRYETHVNNVEDLRYQKFVSPIVNNILDDFNISHKGLDFGSGTGPVITKMLRDQNYNLKTYDIFFDNNPKVLEEKYDFIACCEVIEHFFNPHKEFRLLYDLLNNDGKLYLMTEMYNVESNFDTWYYKGDPTHVFFYTKKTFEWIRRTFGFKSVEFHGRMIILSK